MAGLAADQSQALLLEMHAGTVDLLLGAAGWRLLLLLPELRLHICLRPIYGVLHSLYATCLL